MESNPNRPPQWRTAFGEIAAFRARVFAKVGERPHTHKEPLNWAKFDCVECIEWQKRFDVAFLEELDELKHRPPTDPAENH
jgi:hypothetical protein